MNKSVLGHQGTGRYVLTFRGLSSEDKSGWFGALVSSRCQKVKKHPESPSSFFPIAASGYIQNKCFKNVLCTLTLQNPALENLLPLDGNNLGDNNHL